MPTDEDIAAMVEAALIAEMPDWHALAEAMPEEAAHDRDLTKRALLAALRAAQARGLKLLGREATEKMCEAGWPEEDPEGPLPDDCWRAMHDAAEGVGDG